MRAEREQLVAEGKQLVTVPADIVACRSSRNY
jgi:hypothetical protein